MKPRARKGGAAKKPNRKAHPVEKSAQHHGASNVRVVGVGASAGGLEALQTFFGAMPKDCGLAFVVVQHLDPTHKDMLVDILARSTTLRVMRITDGQKPEAGGVYVLPPNHEVSLLRGVLRLLPPTAPRGHSLPIDLFLRSLAADRGPRAIGVILSGMGSDGALGLAAIREAGGATFVQAPASAKWDAMPRSAIDSGVADVVGTPQEIAARLMSYSLRRASDDLLDAPLSAKGAGVLEKVCLALRNLTGHDFSQYKRNTLHRRIERRMALHQIDDMGSYLRHVQANPQEATLLFKELLIGVTNFFRDPAFWELLRDTALAARLAERPAGGVLRAWVAGCSTGEEAYSVAIVFKEAMEKARPGGGFSLQIFATDLDKDAIERARAGLYPASIAADVSADRLRRFFVREDHGYRVAPEIREAVIFATQNVITDPPFTKLDLLTCRNLLIYLSPELQTKLLPLFHYSLSPGGILFLGSAETPGVAAGLFAPIDGKARLYRRLEGADRRDTVSFPTWVDGRARGIDAPAEEAEGRGTLQGSAERMLLERYSPAAVLTNDQGDILYISGHTGKFLEPAAGKANWNVHAMARDGVRHPLASAFARALRAPGSAVRGLATLEPRRAGAPAEIRVEALREPEALRGLVLIVFSDAAPALPGKGRGRAQTMSASATKLGEEVRQARDALQTTREAMQTSQEELRSANEELQSTNEELQSTNEELTTSKEEMQSLNEELQTLNHELQAKVDELSQTNDDMRNLLDSTDIATLFLDDGLRVRRFTAQMGKIVNLIPGDVNRPITDLASDLVYPDLADDARAVLKTLVFKESSVRTVSGRWYSVRIMPYRTVQNRIDGLVITFTDITAAKQLEAALRREPVAAER